MVMIAAKRAITSGFRRQRWKYAMTPQWNVYLCREGFETPTINELSYRPDGQSGLNFALQPATNTTVEAGSKWQVGTGWRA